jgi:hypothetical protein
VKPELPEYDASAAAAVHAARALWRIRVAVSSIAVERPIAYGCRLIDAAVASSPRDSAAGEIY